MSFSITGVTYLMIATFIIAALGYALGRITIKGVSLGTAGVFIVALLFGALLGTPFKDAVGASYTTLLKVVENLGLMLFVTAVGFIAGPNFFKNFKKNYKSYILLGVIIILAGGLSAIGCIYFGRIFGGETNHEEFTAMIVGLLSGSLTSTPAFSAAKETADVIYENAVTVGHGIAYLFGVIGVVLFVQLMPRIEKADMEEERKKITIVSGEEHEDTTGLLEIDQFGLAPFAVAVVLGIVVGSIKFFNFFSLTTTGGTLLVSLILGHFKKIGKISIKPSSETLHIFREVGLMLFLIGAGIAGGINFVAYFKGIYFIYGVIMTIVPMIVGYIFAKYVLKLPLFNTLGSITGGMTSTPALGTLINVAKTEDVASAYAATYPIALIAVVLVSQLLIKCF